MNVLSVHIAVLARFSTKNSNVSVQISELSEQPNQTSPVTPNSTNPTVNSGRPHHPRYQHDSIKALVERKDGKGKDTCDMSDWWKAKCAKLPAFTYVLRAVRSNSLNSCPPERLFSIFTATFNKRPLK